MNGYYKAYSAHERAIDWALGRKAKISVRDYAADDDEDGNPEYDVFLSSNRKEIIDGINGTDIPNVEIYLQPSKEDIYRYLLTFSVIDEGIPDETICDWTVPTEKAAPWRIAAEKEFDKAVFA